MKYNISVILPVYNEEEGLKKTLVSVIPILKNTFSDYEIIIVESGSTDETGEVADKEAKKNKKIKVIHQHKKKGYGNAIKDGFNHCTKEICIYLDSDNPYDLNYLKEGVKYIGKYDAVIGYRKGERETMMRVLLSKGAYAIDRFIFWLDLKDTNCPFKMIKTSFIKKMNLYSNYSFLDAEILINLKKQRAAIKQIEININKREEGYSKFSDIKKSVLNHLRDIVSYSTNNITIIKIRNR